MQILSLVFSTFLEAVDLPCAFCYKVLKFTYPVNNYVKQHNKFKSESDIVSSFIVHS